MKNNNKFYITTPIYYASGDLHLGHCCTTVYADSLARYNRLLGKDVCFLTGADEHGQKIEERAKEQNLTPKQYVDRLDVNFKKVWELLGISYDKYIRTTDEQHQKSVQKIFTKLYEQGDIYKSEYEGLYCTPCESFFTESQAKDHKCPDCGRDLKTIKEESYFFRLSKYQKQIEEFYENHPDFIKLESTKKEMINSFLKPGLSDLCVSRTSVNWGIRVPFDEKHTIYVWIDALPNYLTALGYMSDDESLFEKYWPADVQLMAKEIARFHLIVWPAILMALNLPIPHKMHAHGWLTKAGQKMGKSLGNGFNPFVLCERYGIDAVRYYLLKEGPIMQDAPYDNETFLKTINNDLCNELGNLLSRTTAMIKQKLNGVLPSFVENSTEFDKEFLNSICAMPNFVNEYMEKLEPQNALTQIFKVVRNANKYIDDTTAWKLEGDALNGVMHNLWFALYSVSIMLKAFIPETSKRIFESLGVSDGNFADISLDNCESLRDNNVQKLDALFKRLKIEDEIKFLTVDSVKKEEKKEAKVDKVDNVQKDELIDFKDFLKVKMVTAKVISAEKVEKAEKLLKLEVEVGNKTKTIVSGIAKHFSPDELVGKVVVIVDNLKPAKLMGIESNGMILACENNGKLSLITPDCAMPSGIEVG